MEMFVIVRKTNGKFQFSLRGTDGRAILISKEYGNKTICELYIQNVKKFAVVESNFNLRNISQVDFYFTLETEEGEVLGSSSIYKSRLACQHDIFAVRKLAPDAEIESYAVDNIYQ